MSCWHGYEAKIPDWSTDDAGDLAPALVFTVIGPTSIEAPPIYEGTVLNRQLTFHHVATWDHEPNDTEKDTVHPDEYRLEGES